MNMNMDFMSDEDEDQEELLHNKQFVNKFFSFSTFEEATEWIQKWYKEMKHNATEFTSDFPALIDSGTDYRSEKLTKY